MLILSFLCLMLLAYGVVFSIINFYTNYDSAAKIFGPFLIALCLMAGVDIWIMPNISSPTEMLYWQRVLHLIACICLVISYHQTLLVTQTHRPRLTHFVHFFVLLMATLMFTDAMLYLKHDKVAGNWGYYAIFFPFAIWYLGFFFYSVLRRLRYATQTERRLLHFHLYGFLVVGLFGMVDMAQFLRPDGASFPVFKIIGILVYGLSIGFIFAERFVEILRDRDLTLAKLQDAYRELEEANTLRQIGESTAIINHEIKNYMFMISGNAQLLGEMEPLTNKGREMVDNILVSVNRLTQFSRDILEMSRTQIMDDKKLIQLGELVRQLVEKQFAPYLQGIQLLGFESEHWIHGDWGKLEHALVNLIKNSIEAAVPGIALQIKIKLHTTPNVVMLTLEDNGKGCNEPELQSMFKAFYTTRKGRGGTGLGLSIARNIVEGHGGSISAYSKNLLPNEGQGMKLHLVFPNYEQPTLNDIRKACIVIVQNQLPGLASLIRVFRNVNVVPYVVRDISEIETLPAAAHSFAVLASTSAATARSKDFKALSRLCLISEYRGSLMVMDPAYSRQPQVFSEEYVLGALLRSPVAKRHRERSEQVEVV